MASVRQGEKIDGVEYRKKFYTSLDCLEHRFKSYF